MTRQHFLRVVIAVAAAMLAGFPSSLHAQTPPASLSGQVSSAEEGAMEGVLVTAKKVDSTIAVTVVSDKDGHYSFPASRLEPGRYAVTIRAGGYDLDGPGVTELAPSQAATLDLKLHRTEDLSQQLDNAEWLLSMPGTDEQKKSMLDCTNCHTVQRIVRSTHTPDEFVKVMQRMAGYTFSSTSLHPQRRKKSPEAEGNPERFRKTAEFLSTVNLSKSSDWSYPLETMPRLTGKSTRVIVTEYDLPRSLSEPHDVRVDDEGKVWFSYFGEQFLGRLDPKTGKITEYPVPMLKPGFPTGDLDLEADKDGAYWLSLMYQGGIGKFDRDTGTFKLFPLPAALNSDGAQQSMVMPIDTQVDGKVWTNDVINRSVLRLDLASGTWESFEPFKGASGFHTPYGLAADSKNNVYFMDFGDRNIGKIDAKTGQSTLFPTPTPASRPRRGVVDAEDRLWFAEWAGNKLAMFDTKAETFQEWPLPTPWTTPYDVVPDRDGMLWTMGMNTDRVVRLDPKTGEVTEYPLPHFTNVRKVFVDNSTTPVTFWVGNNHGAAIIHVEPQE